MVQAYISSYCNNCEVFELWEATVTCAIKGGRGNMSSQQIEGSSLRITQILHAGCLNLMPSWSIHQTQMSSSVYRPNFHCYKSEMTYCIAQQRSVRQHSTSLFSVDQMPLSNSPIFYKYTAKVPGQSVGRWSTEYALKRGFQGCPPEQLPYTLSHAICGCSIFSNIFPHVGTP